MRYQLCVVTCLLGATVQTASNWSPCGNMTIRNSHAYCYCLRMMNQLQSIRWPRSLYGDFTLRADGQKTKTWQYSCSTLSAKRHRLCSYNCVRPPTSQATQWCSTCQCCFAVLCGVQRCHDSISSTVLYTLCGFHTEAVGKLSFVSCDLLSTMVILRVYYIILTSKWAIMRRASPHPFCEAIASSRAPKTLSSLFFVCKSRVGRAW